MRAPAEIGLCSNCRHCQVVSGERSTFYLCRRSQTDPAYPRYPRLPVTSCAGHEAAAGGGDDKLAE
jgi:hypothetical protein